MGKLLDLNRKASYWLVKHTRIYRPNDRELYLRSVKEKIPNSRSILDVGSGRKCKFATMIPPGAEMVILDISAEEMKLNDLPCLKVVADASHSLPFSAESFDLVCSYAVMEHLPNVEQFIVESNRVLRTGGAAVHMIPNRWCHSSILNSLIGNRVARYILHSFIPGSEGRLGFLAYYDHCWPSDIKRVFRQHGFDVELSPYWYQADYYSFCFPLFALVLGYEMLLKKLNLVNLCGSMVITAAKTAR